MNTPIKILIMSIMLSTIHATFAQTCNTCDATFSFNSGLVACYPLDGNANDETANALNGTVSGATLTTDRFGRANKAYSFNGTSNYISLPIASLQLSNYSYSLWVKITALDASARSPISFGGNQADQFFLVTNSAWTTGSYNTGLNVRNSSTSLNLNTNWHHVVFTRNNSETQFYIDGVQYASNTNVSSTGAGYQGGTLRALLGARCDLAQYFNGKIDDVRIYDRPLSATEVSSLYTAFQDSSVRFTDAGSDKLICLGDSTRLTASGADSYTWTPTPTLSSSTASNPYAKPAANTKYYVTGTIGNCTSTDSVSITINTNCCNSCISTVPLNSGLVACYPLDGNASDMISSSNNGTATSTTNTTNRFGRSGSALSFNGSSSKITLPGTNFQLNDYTYSVWIKIATNPSSGNAQAILSFGNNVGPLGDQDIMLVHNYSTPVQTGFNAVSYTNPAIYPLPPDFANSGSLPSTGTWYHLVSTRNTTTGKITLYINGIMVSDHTLSTTAAGYDTPLGGYIGVRAAGGSQFFNGTIDDVRIYNRAITDSEILSLYNMPDIGSTIPVDAGPNITICSGDSIRLNVTGGTTYTWSSKVSLSDSTVANPYAKPTATTKYYVTGSTGNCSATDSIIVYVSTNCCVDCKDTIFTLNKKLVACLPFNGNANDETLNGNNGTVYPSTTLTTNRKNVASKAYEFNGNANSYINVAPSASLNTANMNNFSFACWFNPGTSSTTLARRIFNIQDPSGRNYDLAYSYQVNKLVYINWNGTSGAVNIPTKFTFTPGNWYHVAVTIDSLNNSRVYINGELDTFSTNTVVKPQNPTYSIGRHLTAGWNFIGNIDEVRIYSRALSSNEIKDLMVAGDATVITPFTVSGNATICKSDSVRLTATGARSYVWSPGTTLSDSSVSNPFAKPIVNTKYTVTGTLGTCKAKDSTTITVLPINLNAGTDSSVCSGDSIRLTATGAASYTWSSKVSLSDSTVSNPYAKPATTHKYFVTGRSGVCIATDSITINVNTISLDAGTGSSICKGDSLQLNATGASSYKWNTKSTLNDSTIANPYAKPTATTTYFVTGKSGACTALDSVTITVSSVNADAGTNTQICSGDSIRLQASGGGTYKWRYNTTLSDTTIANPYAKPLANEKYYLTVTNGICSAVDSITVTIASSIVVDAGSNRAICLGDSVQLNATGASNYKWRSNTTLSDSTLSNPFAKPSVKTTYFVSGSTGSCSAIDSVEIDITTITVDAGSNRTICLGDSVQLNASGASNYKWKYNTTLSDSTRSNPFAKPLVKTTYFVSGSTGSCSAIDSVEIDITTITADAGTNHNICSGDSIQLQASGGSIYKWSYNITLSDTTHANPYAKPTSSTQYFVSVSDGTCKATDSVWVNIAAGTQVNAGADQQLCMGDSVQLQATGASTYTWLITSGLSNPNINNPKASPAIPTEYIVKGQTLNCVDYDTVRIAVVPKPDVNLGADIAKCKNDGYTFSPIVTNADQYFWSPASQLSSTSIPAPITYANSNQTFILRVKNSVTGCENADTILLSINSPKASFTLSDTLGTKIPFTVTSFNSSTPSTNLTYQWLVADSIPAYYNTTDITHKFTGIGRFPIILLVTDNLGCTDTLTQFVTVDQELPVFIPNVFTPNSDGINDYFEITYDILNTSSLKGSVWNRWGTKVYEFNQPGGKWWDGTAEGVAVTSDVYYYIIEIENKLGKVQQFHGTVTVLR